MSGRQRLGAGGKERVATRGGVKDPVVMEVVCPPTASAPCAGREITLWFCKLLPLGSLGKGHTVSLCTSSYNSCESTVIASKKLIQKNTLSVFLYQEYSLFIFILGLTLINSERMEADGSPSAAHRRCLFLGQAHAGLPGVTGPVLLPRCSQAPQTLIWIPHSLLASICKHANIWIPWQ